MAAYEQRPGQYLFETTDLQTDGRWSYAQLLGGRAETAKACRGLEAAKGI